MFSSCEHSWGQSHLLNGKQQPDSYLDDNRGKHPVWSRLYGCVCGRFHSLNTRLYGWAINTVVTVPAGIVTYEKLRWCCISTLAYRSPNKAAIKVWIDWKLSEVTLWSEDIDIYWCNYCACWSLDKGGVIIQSWTPDGDTGLKRQQGFTML